MSVPGTEQLSEQRRALLDRLTRGERLHRPATASAIPRTGATSYRATQAQERVWLADRLIAEPVFTIRSVYRLPDGAGEDLVRDRLEWLVTHQDSLRTRFRETDGGLLAEVQRDGPPLEVVDLRHLDRVAARDRLQELVEEAGRHRFDLQADHHLVRWRLVELPGDERLLVSVLHHLVCDVTSFTVALRQVADPSPSPPAVSYADYALWSRGEQRRARLPGELEAWRARLAGAPPPFAPLGDRPRRARMPTATRAETLRLDAKASAAVRTAAHAAGVSEYMFFLAAFTEVLTAWTGERDLVLSTSVDGRVRPELSDLMGLFTNTLLLRLRVEPGASFRERLDAVRELVLDALSRQETPVEDVLRALRDQWPEAQAEPPVHFNSFRLAAGVPPEDYVPTSCQYELCVWAVERAQTFEIHFIYWTALFEAETIRAMAEQFGTVVRRMCERLDQPPLPVPAGYAATGPAVREPPRTVPEAFAEVAAAAPTAQAVIGEDAELRYAGLAAAASELAGRLRAAGAGVGDFVTVTTDRSPVAVVAFLGVLEAGCVYVPVPPDTPGQRRRFLRDDCGAVAAVIQAGGALRVEPLGQPTGRAVTGRPRPVSPAYCVYTSGSTGRPKGVVVGHAGAVAHVRGIADSLGIGPGDRVLQFHGHGFDVAIEHLLSSTLNGATLVLRGDAMWSPAELPRRLAGTGVTVAPLPTAYWHEVAMLGASAWQGHDLSALRVVVPGGEALSPDALERWHQHAPRHVRLVNAYGPTEALMTPTHGELSAGRPQRARAPLGHPVAGRDLAVLDATLRPVPPGAVGELHIGGDLLAHGYHRASGRTAAAFVPDPFAATPGARLYRTGDLVRRTAGGELEFVGRRDEQVKLRGVRIEPGEIEAALRSHPQVSQAAAALVRADDPYIAAWVVGTGQGPMPGAGELRELLRERLPAEMVPRVVLERPALPRTDGGKLDRRALAEELAAAPAPVVGPGDGSVEAAVAAAFAAALNLPSVQPGDDFFSLGGHSLLAAQVATRLSGLLGREVGLIDLLERPTPAALSEAILARGGAGRGGQRIPRRPVAVGDPLPLAPIQQGLWFSSRITTAASYTVPVALELAGPLDVARLEAALRRLVELHTALRCAIVEVDGRPQGRLLAARVALAPRPVADEQRLLDELTRLAAEPIDLADGPLRLALLRLAEESHVLYLGVHHVACDGASIEHLLRQLLAEYEEPGSAAAPAIGFSDYAAWLDDRAAETAADLAWWSEHLAGLPNLELPTDRLRPPVIDHAGDHVVLRFDDDLAARLRAFARERRTTTFTVVLAGWLALVGTWAGQRDFCAGVPMSRRDHPDLAEVVGPVLTTLPVRAGLGGDPAFAELVDRTHAELAACYGAAGVSFERIVEEVAGSRDPARTPLFQTLVSWEGRRDQAAAGDVMATPHVVGNSAAKTDLVLLLEETGSGLAGVVEYATALFDHATAEQVAGTLPRLLAAAVDDPGTRLAGLPGMPGRPSRPAAAPATGRRPAEPSEPVAPRTETERVLERILAAALSIDGLGVHDDFFALGGNSLSAIEATTYVKRVFQVDVPVTALFEAPTVAGLAETLRRRAPSDDHIERVAAIAVDMLLRDHDQAG